MTPISKCIMALSDANGVSGFEDEVVDVIRAHAGDGVSIEEDTLRNVYLTPKRAGSQSGPTVLLDAHSDEVGFIIQAIKTNGLMKFLPMGGWIPHNAAAQKVRVRNRDGRYISGIISSKPPHFMSEADRSKPIAFENLYIDIGAASAKEVQEVYKIHVGAPVVPDVTCTFDSDMGTFMGKAFDNRIGCACVLETLKQLPGDLSCTVVGAIAAQEEVGTRGAQVTARRVKPDIAIVFEGTPADDTFTPEDEAQSVLLKGPQIRHVDKSMITHPRFARFACDVAESMGIPFQEAVRSGGGTNGAPIHLSNQGIPTIVIGTPVRYIHTHNCICKLQDFENAIKWALEIVKRIDADLLKGF